MKNPIKIAVMLFTVLAAACSQENEMIDPKTTGATSELIITQDNEDVIAELIKMGYERSTIIELENYFLVGGDILFSKDIEDYGVGKHDHPRLRHASTNNLVNLTRLNMTVRVDGSIPTSGTDNWRSAVQDAVNDWNGINNCGVFFVYTTSSFADITVRADGGQLPNNVIASAGFPNNKNPYNTVLVNLDFFSNMNVSEAGKRYNMVHELGHCIGFRHTNWDTRGEGVGPYGANLIPGTPNQDPASVMNGGTALNTWAGFSNFDEVAARFLYPFAVRLDYVLTYESDGWDEEYTEEDVFLETYTDGSFTTRLNLPTTRTARYDVVEIITNSWPQTTIRNDKTRTLSAGANRFFLRNIVTEECYYDYGNPIGNCYDRYIDFIGV